MKNKYCPICLYRGGYHYSECPKLYKKESKSRNRYRSERRQTKDDLMFLFREQ